MSSRFVIVIVALASTLAGIVVSPVVAKLPAFALSKIHAKASVDRSGGANYPAGNLAGNSPGAATAVEIAEVKTEAFPIVVSTFANVQAPETVAIGARITSQITEIHVKDGQFVKVGELLFSLDDRALQAQLSRDEAVLAKDSALRSDAEIELERAKTLRDDKTGTEQAYDTALSAERSANATVKADQATVDSDKVALSLTSIVAPISGRLGEVQVAVGDLVGTTTSGSPTTLVTITAIDPIEVAFHLPEGHLQAFKARLDLGTPPHVIARVSGTDEVIGEGVIDFIDSAVDIATGTVMMRARFDNGEQKLWPGQYLHIDVPESTLSHAAVIPAAAVQPGQNGAFVYRIKADDTVEVCPVVVAAEDGKNAAITSGLSAGDRVVTEGQLNLRAGDKVSIRNKFAEPAAKQTSHAAAAFLKPPAA
ncbi:efflux RND transporter periplasmic adaptor subunit [Sinorhizobium meliloti]|uniref:efflux RND transporter periplasmic adaptor subunit n=1 Tax=Rhizobium meliloti TaxID=382 RepID=UPI00237F332F|nr:efflux RND transporter periplasmic adaptor subunit [Sinorhizobium meliloti]MDE3812104.1 efflux RND transporter periplasmic adaptor subunit [Sinorhizobium meliloti]